MEERQSFSFPTEKEFLELDLFELKEKINAIPSIKFFKDATMYLNHIQIKTLCEWEELQNVINKGHDVFFKNYPKVLEKMAAPSPACGTRIMSNNRHSYNNAVSSYNKYQTQNSHPFPFNHQQGGQVRRTVEEISIATTSESSPGQNVASSDRHLFKSASSSYNKYRTRYTGHSNYRRGGQFQRSFLENPMVATPTTPPSTLVASSGRYFYNSASSYSNTYQSQDTCASSKRQQGCQDGRSNRKIATAVSPAPLPGTHVTSSDSHSYKSVHAYNKYRPRYTGTSNYRRGGQSRWSVQKNVATPTTPPSTLVASSGRYFYNTASSYSNTYQSQDTCASSYTVSSSRNYNKYRPRYAGPLSSNYRRGGKARRSVHKTPLQSRQFYHLRRL